MRFIKHLVGAWGCGFLFLSIWLDGQEGEGGAKGSPGSAFPMCLHASQPSRNLAPGTPGGPGRGQGVGALAGAHLLSQLSQGAASRPLKTAFVSSPVSPTVCALPHREPFVRALNEALLPPPPLPPCFFSQPQAPGGGFLRASELGGPETRRQGSLDAASCEGPEGWRGGSPVPRVAEGRPGSEPSVLPR